MTTPTSTAANLDACSKSLLRRVFTLVLLLVCIQLTACRTEMLRTAEEKMKEDAADPQNRVKIVPGADVDEAQRKLETAGRVVDIGFQFGRIGALPDTREANRLVHLAAQDSRQGELIDGVFRAFFESGRDIGNPLVLVQLAVEAGVDESVRLAFTAGPGGRDEVLAEERRLRGLGVEGVPNLLLNSRVLVPGAADVPTYIQALDQALFPENPTPERQRLLN